MKQRSLYLTLFFAFILLAGTVSSSLVVAKPTEPQAVSTVPNWQGAVPLSQTGGAITGGILPSIASSDDGSKILVLFSNILNDDNGNHDIFFARSTDYGESWTGQARVHLSGNDASDSNFGDVTITPNNKGHAVWIEEVSNVPRLVYKIEDNWNGTSNFRTIANLPNSFVVAEPQIVAKSNNRLDVVWSQGVIPDNPNIYHAYSRDGGINWEGVSPIVNTPPTSRLPDIAIDGSGNYHVVWEEGTVGNTTIQYLRGVPSVNGTVNWNQTPVLNISQQSITGENTTQPKILTVGNVLHVTYTVIESDDRQFVHYLRCTNNCQNNVANWVSVGNPISGQIVGANASDPFDVIPTIAQAGQCIYAYFHGVQAPNTNEQLWGVNSCGNWSASARDQVTPSSIRTINPSLTAGNSWWLYLAYEQVNPSTDVRQIFFIRNRPAIYLPTVTR